MNGIDLTLFILIVATLLACLGIPTAYVIAIIRKVNRDRDGK